jgi:hypothetical protein
MIITPTISNINDKKYKQCFIQIFSSGGTIQNSGRADTCFRRDRLIVCGAIITNFWRGVAFSVPTLRDLQSVPGPPGIGTKF